LSKVPSSLRLLEDLDLLSSTPGITVVGGFPIIASPESPCASETISLFLAVNGRTSTAPSRPERGSLAHCQPRNLPWPTNRLSKFRSVTWSESLPSSQRDKLIRRPPNLTISQSLNITVRGARKLSPNNNRRVDSALSNNNDNAETLLGRTSPRKWFR